MPLASVTVVSVAVLGVVLQTTVDVVGFDVVFGIVLFDNVIAGQPMRCA